MADETIESIKETDGQLKSQCLAGPQGGGEGDGDYLLLIIDLMLHIREFRSSCEEQTSTLRVNAEGITWSVLGGNWSFTFVMNSENTKRICLNLLTPLMRYIRSSPANMLQSSCMGTNSACFLHKISSQSHWNGRSHRTRGFSQQLCSIVVVLRRKIRTQQRYLGVQRSRG